MGETPTCYRFVVRKARREHRCCECHGIIAVGESYDYHSGIWDGEPADYKVCVDCDELRRTVVKDCGLWEEETPALTCLGDDLELSHLDDFRTIQRKRNSNSRSFLSWLAEAEQKGGAK